MDDTLTPFLFEGEITQGLVVSQFEIKELCHAASAAWRPSDSGGRY